MTQFSFKKAALAVAVASAMGSAAIADVFTPTGTVSNSNGAGATTSIIGGGTTVAPPAATSSAPSAPGSAQSLYGTGPTTGYVIAGGGSVNINFSQQLGSTNNSATFDSTGLTLAAGSSTDQTTATGVITAQYVDSLVPANNKTVYFQAQLQANPAYNNALPVGPGNQPLIPVTDANGNPVPLNMTEFAAANLVPADATVVSNDNTNTGGANLVVGGNLTVAGTTTNTGAVINNGTVTNNGAVTNTGTTTTNGIINTGAAISTGSLTATGAISGGAITGTSVNAGSGSITTTGAINGGAITGTSVTSNGPTTLNGSLSVDTNGGAANVSGTSVLNVANGAVSFGVTNANGHVNGASANSSSATITGGTSSSTLVVDDNGITVSTNGGTAKIMGVANGTAATDATNKGQLDAEVTRATGAEGNRDYNASLNANQVADGANLTSAINGENARATAAEAAETGRAMNAEAALGSQVQHLEEDMSSGIASAVAMANIPQVGEGQTMSVGTGVGSFNGEESLAVGGSYRINTNTIMKGSLATGVSSGDTAVGLGVGYSW